MHGGGEGSIDYYATVHLGRHGCGKGVETSAADGGKGNTRRDEAEQRPLSQERVRGTTIGGQREFSTRIWKGDVKAEVRP